MMMVMRSMRSTPPLRLAVPPTRQLSKATRPWLRRQRWAPWWAPSAGAAGVLFGASVTVLAHSPAVCAAGRLHTLDTAMQGAGKAVGLAEDESIFNGDPHPSPEQIHRCPDHSWITLRSGRRPWRKHVKFRMCACAANAHRWSALCLPSVPDWGAVRRQVELAGARCRSCTASTVSTSSIF